MLDRGSDQAAGLRKLFAQPALRILPLAGACDAASDVSFVINLATALARSGVRCLVIDAGREGLCPAIGLKPRHELADLLAGALAFSDAALRARAGFSVLPARRGLASLAGDAAASAAFFETVAALPERFDLAILHAEPAQVASLMARQLSECVVLCGPADEDLTAAYARVKALVASSAQARVRVLFDRSDSPEQTARRHRRLAEVARRFLNADLEYGGAVARDLVPPPSRSRASVFETDASGPTARSFERLAQAVRQWQLPAIRPAAAPIL